MHYFARIPNRKQEKLYLNLTASYATHNPKPNINNQLEK